MTLQEKFDLLYEFVSNFALSDPEDSIHFWDDVQEANRVLTKVEDDAE